MMHGETQIKYKIYSYAFDKVCQWTTQIQTGIFQCLFD